MSGKFYVALIARGIRSGLVDQDAQVQLGFNKGDNTQKLVARFWTGVQPPLYHELRQMSQNDFDWLVDEGYLLPAVDNAYSFNIEAFTSVGSQS